ncbi:hypothetical protein, partial [Escherichia fergusonii]|uniref:hypothetical protein n=1 Tax=Escherichia fergusonii TaxID=564 RepID=UPI001D67243D
LVAAFALTLTGTPSRAQEPPQLPPSQRDAARLAGLAGFVNLSCDRPRTDQDRFKGAIQAMGVDPKDMDGGALMLQAAI